MKLLIIEEYADYYKNALVAEFPEIEINAVTNEEDAGAFIKQAQVLVAIKATNDLIAKAENLEWIQSLISGTDFFTTLPALKKDVLISSSKGFHGPQVAETTFLLMLNLNRKYNDNYKDRLQKKWERWPTTLLYKKAVGILGVGVIGKEIARKCKAFDMTVHGLTSSKRSIEYVDYSYSPDQLTELFGKVDYLVNILPSNDQTRNSIGREQFAAMKPSAFFINIGRGDTVDEKALIETLQKKKISGAGLDVFAIEPLPENNPLWELENVVMTPHIGGMSDIYCDQVLPIIKENIRRYLKGERLDLINFIDWTH